MLGLQNVHGLIKSCHREFGRISEIAVIGREAQPRAQCLTAYGWVRRQISCFENALKDKLI